MAEIKKESKALQVKSSSYQIDKPQQMARAADLIRQHIEINHLAVEIQNSKYVMVEGWQYGGGLMGLFPRIVWVKNLGPDKWMAKAEIIEKRTGLVVGIGYGLCSKEERKKASFDEYAILSMAQTRAIGKAYRNTVGWVMKMAGYEATPAEEYKAGFNPVNDVPNVKKATEDENKIKMIKAQNDPAVLMGWRKNINSNTKYTLAEKQEFNREITKRLAELEKK